LARVGRIVVGRSFAYLATEPPRVEKSGLATAAVPSLTGVAATGSTDDLERSFGNESAVCNGLAPCRDVA